MCGPTNQMLLVWLFTRAASGSGPHPLPVWSSLRSRPPQLELVLMERKVSTFWAERNLPVSFL